PQPRFQLTHPSQQGFRVELDSCGWGHHGRAKYITSRAIGVVIFEVLATNQGYYRSRVTSSSTGGLLIRFSYRRQPRRLFSSNPSSSSRNCAKLICVTATSSFGHWNV